MTLNDAVAVGDGLTMPYQSEAMSHARRIERARSSIGWITL